MDKKQTLDLIKSKVEDGTINKKDLIDSLDLGNTPDASVAKSQASAEKEKSDIGEKIIHTLYLIGAIIVIAGVVLLLAQNWEEIGFLGRLLSTSGLFLVAYLVGLFTVKGENGVLSQISFVVSAILTPIAIYVLMEEAGYHVTLNTAIISSGALTVLYGATQYYARNKILVLVTAIFGTILYITAILKVFEFGSFTDILWIIKIATILLGVAYYMIAYGYASAIKQARGVISSGEKSVSRVFYGFGSLAILIPFMTYTGIWDFLNFFITIGIAYLGFFVKSKLIFFIAAITLIIHLISLTWEYFQGSIAWPILLIIIGILIVGIAYGSIRMSGKISGGAGNSV